MSDQCSEILQETFTHIKPDFEHISNMWIRGVHSSCIIYVCFKVLLVNDSIMQTFHQEFDALQIDV